MFSRSTVLSIKGAFTHSRYAPKKILCHTVKIFYNISISIIYILTNFILQKYILN